MHNVITNAWRGDPYRIDTLMIFMANMAWNSTMNTVEVRRMLNDRDDDGEYKIPFLVVCDAFQSEMTAFADLVLPDTTYLERHDVMSMLDRPISEFDGPIDSVRVPVVPPAAECRPFQEVLIELAGRLGFPAFTNNDGSRKFKDYPDFIVRYETEPGSGHRLPRRLARRGRLEVAARRAQSEAVGEVRGQQLRATSTSCRPRTVHAQLEPRLHGVGAARAHAPLRRADPDPDLLRGAAALPPRGAGQAAAGAGRPSTCASASRPTSIRCRSSTRRSSPR